MNDILAFHIVWTTYGTWLSGDERGWVEWGGGKFKPQTRTRSVSTANG